MNNKNMILSQIKNYANKLQEDVDNKNYILGADDTDNIIELFDKIDFDFYEYLAEWEFYTVESLKEGVMMFLNEAYHLDYKINYDDLTLDFLKSLENEEIDEFYNKDELCKTIDQFIYFSDFENYDYIHTDVDVLFYNFLNKINLLDVINEALREMQEIKGVA